MHVGTWWWHVSVGEDAAIAGVWSAGCGWDLNMSCVWIESSLRHVDWTNERLYERDYQKRKDDCWCC